MQETRIHGTTGVWISLGEIRLNMVVIGSVRNYGDEDQTDQWSGIPAEADSDHVKSVKRQWRCILAWQRVHQRMQDDNHFKENVYYSVCIYSAFFVIGWIKGQFGPAFPDLRSICGVDIEKGSWIVTIFYIGYTFGSIMEGLLYNRVNRKLLFGACLFILAAMVAAVPWCYWFEAMASAHFVQGAMEGVLDPGGNAEILRIWGRKGGRTAILGMNFALSIGTVISPLATAPFLGEIDTNVTLDDTEIYQNITTKYQVKNYTRIDHNATTPIILYENGSAISTVESPKGNKLYIAFSITAIVSFTIAISFLVLNIVFTGTGSSKRFKEAEDNSTKKIARRLPRRLSILSLSVIGACLFTFNAIDEAFIAYLSTFCVTYFHWSKNEGAFVTSLLFISNLISRLLYIVISKWLNSLVCVGIHSLAMLLSLLGVLIASLNMIDTGIWVFVPLFGYGKSIVFALLFSWTNEYLTPVTGTISSVFFISAMVGSSINPLLLGYLMKEVATVSFCYLFVAEGVLLVLLYVIGVLVTKYITHRFGKVFIIKEEEDESVSARL